MLMDSLVLGGNSNPHAFRMDTGNINDGTAHSQTILLQGSRVNTIEVDLDKRGYYDSSPSLQSPVHSP